MSVSYYAVPVPLLRTPAIKRALETAEHEARSADRDFLDTGDLLLALYLDDCVAAKFLQDHFALSPDELRTQIQRFCR